MNLKQRECNDRLVQEVIDLKVKGLKIVDNLDGSKYIVCDMGEMSLNEFVEDVAWSVSEALE